MMYETSKREYLSKVIEQLDFEDVNVEKNQRLLSLDFATQPL